ncbi:MAG: hypothetical protein F6J92_25035 [Symploca sp. SIO1A3]|nr:hypothetical protein [Symploca sp. SIO1A3]
MGRQGSVGRQGRQGDRKIGKSILNSQFPIPNSQFPIPNSQFPIPKQPTTNNN